MAELDILPAWASNYLTANILDHARVLNALPIEGGRNAFLLNTSRGAMILQKKRFGEPHHWLLPLPGLRATFDCDACGEHMAFVNPEVPRMVHCPHCSAEYTLVDDEGALRLLAGEEVVPTPTPAPAARPATAATPRVIRTPEPASEPVLAEPEPVPEDPAPASGTSATSSVASAADPTHFTEYTGDIHPVLDVEGIGPVYAQALRAIGVRTTARLCYEDAGSLAERIGARQRTVESWQEMARLMMVKGVGPQYAEVLVRAGIDLGGLRRRSPDRIAATVNTYLEGLQTNVLGNRVTPKRVAGWQEAAKQLRRVRQPVPAE